MSTSPILSVKSYSTGFKSLTPLSILFISLLKSFRAFFDVTRCGTICEVVFASELRFCIAVSVCPVKLSPYECIVALADCSSFNPPFKPLSPPPIEFITSRSALLLLYMAFTESFISSLASFISFILSSESIVAGTIAIITPALSKLSLPILIVKSFSSPGNAINKTTVFLPRLCI